MSLIRKIVGMGLLGGAAIAAPHSVKELENVAVNFAAMKDPAKLWHVEAAKQKSLLFANGDFYGNFKVIHLKPTGWVIVSTDDVARPVLAYNLEENNTGVVPINFKNWMKQIDEEIEWAKNNHTPSAFSEKWKNLTLPHDKFLTLHQKENTLEASSESSTVSTKGPLLQTTWNQGKYYNTKCPADSDGPDGHVWAGCVATAMSQIMKYYNWPVKGKGSHSYDSDYGTLSANFGHTTYKWKSMPDNLTDYNDAIATLLYHAGVSVNMQYSPDGSGAYMSDADKALKNYFRYRTSGRAFRNNMNADEWDALLKSELDHNRPVLYAGYGTGGHAFVCDGYDYSDSSDKKYHFNWGWSGYYNGYYAIGALDPGNYKFDDNNEIIYGIVPVRKMKAPANLRAKQIKKTSVVLKWKDTTRNEEGFKIYNGSELIKTLKANVTRTKIRHLTPGTRYTLRISAYRSDAESRHVPVRFKTQGKRPAIPLIKFDQVRHDTLTNKVASTHRSGAYAKYFKFRLKSAKSIQIDLSSTDFDTYLFLLDGIGKTKSVLAYNDDEGESTNSQIIIDLEAGSYTIEATSYAQEKTGNFTLQLKEDQ